MQACRAGGWLAYRPDWYGNLVQASTQEWARPHLLTSGRISADQLSQRYSWLDESGKPTRTDQTDYSQEKYCHLPPAEPDEADL